MASITIHRTESLPGALAPSSIYITKNPVNAALVDLTFVGNDVADVRHAIGHVDVKQYIDIAIANLTAEQIPALPGSKIISTLSVDTTGNAATSTTSETTGKLRAPILLNGVSFDGSQDTTVPAVDTATPRVAVADIGVTVAPVVGGLIPKQYIPASFDNIENFPTLGDFPPVGRKDAIYVDDSTTLMYRWANTEYIQIPSGAGVADKANSLSVPRNIALAGDATGNVDFDGSQNVSIAVVLSNVVAAGPKGGIVTTDAKGRVIDSRALAATDLPAIPGEKISSAISVDTTGNAATATALKAPFTVTVQGAVSGSASVSGDANVVINTTLNGSGVSGATGTFAKTTVDNGIVTAGGALTEADIPAIPGSRVNSILSVGTTGNAATATKLAAPVTLSLGGDLAGAVAIDGSGNVVLNATVTAVPQTSGATGTFVKMNVDKGLVQSSAPLLDSDIPALPGSKIVSILSVDTTGKAAFADSAQEANHAQTATIAQTLEIVAEW